jgi:hypothetical protein
VLNPVNTYGSFLNAIIAIYSSIHGLFNDAASIQDVYKLTVSNDTMISE